MRKIFSAALCTMVLGIGIAVPVNADTTEEKENVVYAPDVVVLEDACAYTMEETAGVCEVTLPDADSAAEVLEGDHIILPASEENPAGAALVVTDVEETEEGIRLTCGDPEALSDFVESMDIRGYGTLLPEGAEGGKPSIKARGIGVDIGNQAVKAGRVDYQFQDTLLSGSAVLNGSVSVEISSIEYRLKMDVGLRETVVEDFYFAVNHTVNVDADIWFGTDGLASGGELKLGTVPFVLGGTGVSGDITFWLEYDVKGNLNVAYTLSNVAGISYGNGTYRPFAQNENSLAALAGLDFTAGPKMQFALRYGGKINLFDVTLKTGLSGKADACADGFYAGDMGYGIDTYAYLSILPGKDGLVNRALDLKDMDVWNAGTSPFRTTIRGAF